MGPKSQCTEVNKPSSWESSALEPISSIKLSAFVRAGAKYYSSLYVPLESRILANAECLFNKPWPLPIISSHLWINPWYVEGITASLLLCNPCNQKQVKPGSFANWYQTSIYTELRCWDHLFRKKGPTTRPFHSSGSKYQYLHPVIKSNTEATLRKYWLYLCWPAVNS